MDKIPFEDGTLVKAGYVEIDGTKHEVEPAEYTGKTPLSAYNLNKMQDNIEADINTKAEEQNTLREDGDLVRKIEISGASNQETREGYNKLKVLNINTTTMNGITFTSLGDGTIKANGTATANALYKFTDADGSGTKNGRIEAGTYTVYSENSNYNTAFLQLSVLDDESGDAYYNPSPLKTFETTGANFAGIIYVRSGVTLNNVIFKPMLLEGAYTVDTIPEFEQYGAMPSIEYEAPIESVGDNINLFDKDNANILNGYITDSKFQKGNDYRTLYIPCEANETYAISKVVSSRFIIATSEEMPASQVPITDYQRTDNATELTITTSSNAKYLLVQFRSTSDTLTEEEIINSIKICKGTSAGAYSPYGQGSIEIYNSNENWFDKNKISTAIGGVSGYVASDYISAKIGDKIAKSNSTTLYFYDSSKTLIQGVSNWKTGTIVIENTAYVRCNVLETEVDTFMLVKNQDLPSEYVQSKTQTKALYTQQPFRAIRDVKDSFVKVDGVWYEEHNIDKVVLDGTQTIAKGLASEQTNTIYITVQYANVGLLAYVLNCMCENLKAYTASYLWDNDVEGIGQSQSQIVLRISKERATTASEVKTFLASNPITVYTKKATPTLIECTPEQVEVLNDIYSAYGKGMTNIICNDEVPAVIEITKESKETVQSENDKTISTLLERVSQLEELVASMQSTAVEEGA